MLDWTTIDTVLLDMDGTLLDLHFDNHFWLDYVPRRYAEARGIPEADAKRELRVPVFSLADIEVATIEQIGRASCRERV
mgnify:CR=1 FL=1